MRVSTPVQHGKTFWISATAAVALLVASAAAAPQRAPAAEGKPTFEAATIKLAAANAARTLTMPITPNRVSIGNMTLRELVYAAYGDGGFNTSMRVTGGPEWGSKTTFAVEAVAAENTTSKQLRLMLQRLLEERFALEVRDATNEDAAMGDVLALVVNRSDGTLGPNVKTWTGPCPPTMPALVFPAARRPAVNGPPLESVEPNVAYCPTGYRAGGITADGVTMTTVAELLSLPPARSLLGTITQDRTGLTGRYLMELEYLFLPQGTAPPPSDFAPPSLSTVVLEQWGLRLVPSKGRIKTIVIESAQLPTPN
jgi:uncharacterized protein (TIGR03435 family)